MGRLFFLEKNARQCCVCALVYECACLFCSCRFSGIGAFPHTARSVAVGDGLAHEGGGERAAGQSERRKMQICEERGEEDEEAQHNT